MIQLEDTFNRTIISRHRTVLAAVRAQRKHAEAVRRANGNSSYIPYAITCTTGEHTQNGRAGGSVCEHEIIKAEQKIQ